MTAKEQTALALADPRAGAIEPWRGADWQRLWLTLQSKRWTSLALVPASAGAPADFTLKIGLILARTGQIHVGSSLFLADGTAVQLSNMVTFTDEIADCRQTGSRILLALAPITDNPVTEALVQAADCALLCVMFESMTSAETKRTVSKIGKDRFIGSTVFRPDDLAAFDKDVAK